MESDKDKAKDCRDGSKRVDRAKLAVVYSEKTATSPEAKIAFRRRVSGDFGCMRIPAKPNRKLDELPGAQARLARCRQASKVLQAQKMSGIRKAQHSSPLSRSFTKKCSKTE